MDSEEGASHHTSQDGLSPHHDQYKQKESRSPQNYRRNPPNQQNFPGNNGGMFDPMMAMNMNMGMMNPLQFQLMTMQQTGMPRPQHSQQQKYHHQQQQQQRPSESQAPPPGYVCHKCGQAGHWIYYCPNVPKGQYVPRQNNALQSTQIPALTEADSTPDELVCTICNELFRNASISLCCGKSFCEDCIINTLNETRQCPHCGKNASSDQVVPNKTLRKIVGVFKEERESPKESPPDRNQQDPTNTDNAIFEGPDASHQTGSDEMNTMTSNENKQQSVSPSLNEQRLPNHPPSQKHNYQQQQQQQNYSPFDSTDNTRSGHGRKQNTQGMDPMGRGFNSAPPAGLPFMANPAMFMGGNGAVPPFGFPDMSWMFGANGAGNNSGIGRGGAFPPMNGMQMLPSFFGGNNGAPIHYPGGFSGRGRGAGNKNLANTQQHKQQQQQQQQPQYSGGRRQSDTTPYDPSNATGDSKAPDTSVPDFGTSHRRHHSHDDDNVSEKEGHDSTRSRHRSPHSRSSSSRHRDSRKRSRSRSHSPSERHSSSRRRYSNSSSSGYRKSRRTSRSPVATTTSKHHHDDGDDIVDYGDEDFEDEDEDEDKDDHHHRRHRRSSSSRHHRSGSSRRHHGSSSTRHRSSSRHRHSDDHRKSDRYRDSSRDRSYRREKK